MLPLVPWLLLVLVPVRMGPPPECPYSLHTSSCLWGVTEYSFSYKREARRLAAGSHSAIQGTTNRLLGVLTPVQKHTGLVIILAKAEALLGAQHNSGEHTLMKYVVSMPPLKSMRTLSLALSTHTCTL